MLPVAEKFNEIVCEGISLKELKQLDTLLTKMTNNLENQYEGKDENDDE
ncbi:hypothetical protein [Halobacillus andaensis]